ncbi:hypothetical protein EGM70_07940 [Enterobacteriaceae bacterium 89]|nr:hypothetical protein [Enterobacteriaceae bacterium 89]
MQAMSKVKITISVTLMAMLILSLAIFVYHRFRTPGHDVNCSTILHYDHRDPDFVSTVEMNLRLKEDRSGFVVLSGNVHSENEASVVSRRVEFDYEITSPGEISIRNLNYVKNRRDTTSDDFFKKSFFFTQQGTHRQMRLSPYGNAWLMGNPQSPFALCVNHDQ